MWIACQFWQTKNTPGSCKSIRQKQKYEAQTKVHYIKGDIFFHNQINFSKV